MMGLEDLPEDVLLHVAAHFNIQDVLSLKQVRLTRHNPRCIDHNTRRPAVHYTPSEARITSGTS